ncbi:MAG: hypothetical protein F2702_05000, partial [Actinobacteria bacterium]|nr:hypothetical protein [Actinomycetota bacterium]
MFNTGECPLCVTWALDPDKAQRIGLSQDVHVKRQPLVLVLSVTLLSSTVLLAPAALAAPFAPAASTEQAESRINGRLAARIDNPRFGSDLAVAVLDAATGRVVFSRRANEPMLPASNMKIITAVTTVAAVGPDRTFRTAVFAGP